MSRKKVLKTTLIATRMFLNGSWSIYNNCAKTNQAGKSCNIIFYEGCYSLTLKAGDKISDDLSVQCI